MNELRAVKTFANKTTELTVSMGQEVGLAAVDFSVAESVHRHLHSVDPFVERHPPLFALRQSTSLLVRLLGGFPLNRFGVPGHESGKGIREGRQDREGFLDAGCAVCIRRITQGRRSAIWRRGASEEPRKRGEKGTRSGFRFLVLRRRWPWRARKDDHLVVGRRRFLHHHQFHVVVVVVILIRAAITWILLARIA